MHGYWRIDWMEMWDKDYLDMEVSAHITIDKKGVGVFQFGVVCGNFHVDTQDKHFSTSWMGNMEYDEAFGKIDAHQEGEELHGTISFFEGDESEFRAITGNKPHETN